MADVENEDFNFEAIDEEIFQNRLKKLLIKDEPSAKSLPLVVAEWDSLPTETPPKRIDMFKIGVPTFNNWNKYTPIKADEYTDDDDYITNDDYEIPNLVSNLYNDNKKKEESWVTELDNLNTNWSPSNKTDADYNDVYDSLYEIQMRVDKLADEMDDLTDLVKTQHSTMMKMIMAIYHKVNDMASPTQIA